MYEMSALWPFKILLYETLHVSNVEEIIWQPTAENLKKHQPNAPCTQVTILPITVYRDLQNARSKQTNRNLHTPGKQTITQNTTYTTNSRPHTQTNITYLQVLDRNNINNTYLQVLDRNNINNQTDNIGVQMNTFLNKFKAMFTQLIKQNSMILTMLTTVINNKLNNGR